MTTEPRSLREALAFEGIKHPERLHDQARRLLFEAADRNLAALRTALAANPNLMDELLPAGYAEAASIVRALAKADETEDWLLDADTLMIRVREWVHDMSALRIRARAWVTEHPESG